jgi:hypothetical protein
MNNVLKSLKSLKPVGLLLALAVIGAGVTGAQTTGENITKKFKLQDLLERRGQIQIGVNVPTSIEFDEPIVEHIIGRDDLLIDGLSKAKPNRVYFRAKENKGSSSIDITLEGGATALFTFTVNPKITEGLRYVVKGKSESANDETSDDDASKPATPAAQAKPAEQQPAPQSAKPKPIVQSTASKPVQGAASTPAAQPQPQAAVEQPASTETATNAITGTGIFESPEANAPTAESPAQGAEVAPAAPSNAVSTPVPLTHTINAIRHYDPKVERPADLAVNFNERNSKGKQLEFELAIENRGTLPVNFDPGSMNVYVYVYGNTSATNPRLRLFLTLAPKFDLRNQIEVAPGGVFSRRFVMNAEMDRRQMFEYVADFALVHDEATVQYRRSIYR